MLKKKNGGELSSFVQNDYVAISHRVKAGEAIELLKSQANRFRDKSSYIYVTDEEKRLVGVLQMQDLLVSDLGTPVTELMKPEVISVSENASREEALRLFERFRFFAIPVVDQAQHLVGVLSVQTIKPFSSARPGELYQFTHFTEEEIEGKSVIQIVTRRLPWLLISLLCGLACAYILGIFVGKVETIIALILFVPIVLGLSGSIGTQSAAIVSRGLGEGKLAVSKIGKVFLKELGVASVIGVIIAIAVILFSLMWKKGPLLGFALGAAVVVNVVVSGLLGIILPIVFHMFQVKGKPSNFGSGLFLLLVCDTVALICYFLITLSILDPVIEIV